jgi:hypothetical protein
MLAPGFSSALPSLVLFVRSSWLPSLIALLVSIPTCSSYLHTNIHQALTLVAGPKELKRNIFDTATHDIFKAVVAKAQEARRDPKQNRWEESRGHFQQALEMMPSHWDVRRIYADVLNRARRPVEAEEQFAILLSESPPSSWHLIKKGQVWKALVRCSA